LTRCRFTSQYYDYESRSQTVVYNCDSKDEDILPSGLCIFHDENYLKEDNDNHKEREQKVRGTLMNKVRNGVDEKKRITLYRLSSSRYYNQREFY
jgi:hypothetical protein